MEFFFFQRRIRIALNMMGSLTQINFTEKEKCTLRNKALFTREYSSLDRFMEKEKLLILITLMKGNFYIKRNMAEVIIFY